MAVRIALFLLFVLGAGCSSNNEENKTDRPERNIIITGKLQQGAGHQVTLDRMGATAFYPVDSLLTDDKGRFKFCLQADGLTFFALKHTPHGYITVIAEPGDTIHIEGQSTNLYPYHVRGSQSSALMAELGTAHQEVLEKLRHISDISLNLRGSEDYTRKKLELNARFDSITNAFKAYSRNFIQINAPSPAILFALYNQFGPGMPVLDPLNDLDIYQFVDSTLYTRYPDNDAVRALHSELATAILQLKNSKPSEKLNTGVRAPDFVIQTMENKPLALSDLKGKYVLLHFWASWSKPSTAENPYLEMCYNACSGKSFAIIQVSLDNNKEQWLDAAGDLKNNWFHVSELNRWDSKVAAIYGVDRIPANFLLDPSGTIIEKDIFGEEMLSTVRKLVE